MKTNEPGIDKIEGKKGTIYRVQIRKSGCKHQSRSFSTFKAAKKWKYDTINALSSGGVTDTAEMRRTRLKDLIDRYIDSVLDPFSSNYRTAVGQLSWWKEELGHIVATELSENLISKALDRLSKTSNQYGKSRKAATVNRYFMTLACVLGKAHREWRLITRNPTKHLKKRPEPRKKKRVLTLEESRKLLDVCRQHPSDYVLPLIAIFLCTGVRKGEVLQLRQKDFCPEREEIFLEKTKNGESRTVPIVEPALGILKSYTQKLKNQDDNALVFPGRSPDKPVDFRATWKAIQTEMGLEEFSLHSIRHTTISLLSELQVPVHIIAQIVGHKTLAMTMHYTNPSENFIRSSLTSLGLELV